MKGILKDLIFEREAEISTLRMEVRGSRRMPDSTEMRVEEVRDAIKRMNSETSTGKDGVKVEMSKSGNVEK